MIKMHSHKNVCRLCLKLVHGTDAVLINEVTRKMLGVLLIKLDLDISHDLLICCMCSDILDEIYMFKSKCLYSEDIISDHFDRNFKVNLRDILIEIQNKPDLRIAEDEVICRLCIKIPANDNYVPLNKTDLELGFSRDMMQIHLLPEINLSITEEPIACEECHILLKNYTSFVNNYVDVERKIKLYLNHPDTSDKEPVDLNCVLHFIEHKEVDCGSNLNENLIIKQEEASICVKVEQFEAEENNLSNDHYVDNSNTEVYTKNEEAKVEQFEAEENNLSNDHYVDSSNTEVYTKNEEAKVEQFEAEENNLSKDHYVDNSNTEVYTKNEEAKVEQFEAEENNLSNDHYVDNSNTEVYTKNEEANIKYKCDGMRVEESESEDFNSQEGKCTLEEHRCSLCTFIADTNCLLEAHMKSHRGAVKVFVCPKCTYETDFKYSLVRHLLNHNQGSTKDVYKCPVCLIECQLRSAVLSHWKKMHDTNMQIYECKKCSFSTKYMNSFARHESIHANKILQQNYNGRQMHKCNLCSFWAKSRITMECHMNKTHVASSTSIYKCTHCTYESVTRGRILLHMRRRHLIENNDVVWDSNFNEELILKQKDSVKIEQLEDEDNVSEDRYADITRIELYHKNEEAETTFEDKRMRVEPDGSGDCNSPGKSEFSKERQEAKCTLEGHKCNLCIFIADTSDLLEAHMKSHRGPTKAFSCPKCHYETDFRYYLVRHLLTHKDKSNKGMYKCLVCPLRSKYKLTVLRHWKNKHDTNIPMYKCKECPYITKYSSSFARHCLVHMKTVAMHNCDKCAYSTHFRTSLQQHMQVHQKDSERKMYKCKLCSFEAKSRMTVESHKVKIHKDPSMPVFKCPHCPLETVLKGLLVGHMRRKHSTKNKKDSRKKFNYTDLILECDKCEFQTNDVNRLLDHMYRHDPSKQSGFKCDQCGYCTRDKSSLNQHQLTHMVQ